MTHSTLRAAMAALAIVATPALVTGPAIAQTSPLQPAIGDPLPFTLPATRSFALENGLEVTFINYGLAPTVRINVRMEIGNINDGPNTYLADLTADMMEEGSAGRSAEELATSIASMGGSVNVGVGWHTMSVGTNVLSQYGPQALALLSDVVLRPDMAEGEFDRVRQNMIRDTSVSRAQPGPIATEAFREILFGADHPYGHSLPTEEQVRGYELPDVQSFYADNFGAGRTHIYVAGRFDQATMEASIREQFGDWQTGNASEAGGATPHGGPIVRMIDRPGTPQSTLRVGFPSVAIDHPDARSIEVMNALLGGSFTSRLTQNLREDKGYTYSPRSGQSWVVGGGYWTFNADVNTEVTGAALMETFSEISRLKSEPIPAAEGDGIRTWMSGIFVLNNASTGGVIGQLANSEFWGLGDDYLGNYVPSLMAVSNDDISRVANEYLDLDQLVLVIVGDLAVIEDQVRALPELANATFIMPEAE